MATATKGKIGVLIEDHFDSTEYRKFNEFFPTKGYEVEYITHLWGQKELHFGSNPENNVIEEKVTVSTEVNDINPSDYQGIICIGAYAMDRLRYQVNPKKGEKNQAPAVAFLRNAVNTENVKLGAICHSLWLFCADNEMLKDKKVTCAHNIICDVENAGADVVFEGDQTADLVIDGNLITAKHPGVTDEFMQKFVDAIEANN